MIVYIAVVVIGLIVLGDSQPKIALSLAALILFGSILLNKDVFTKLIGGSAVYNAGFGGFGNGSSSGALYSGLGGSTTQGTGGGRK